MTAPAVKILVVDDEAPIRRLLRVGLTNEGYTILEAADAGEATASLAEEKPDVIILDLGLPDIQGHDLLASWRGSGLELPILVLSSRTDEAGIVKALELGADDYVTKPFGVAELAAHPHQHPFRAGLHDPRWCDGVLHRQRLDHRLLVDAQCREPHG